MSLENSVKRRSYIYEKWLWLKTKVPSIICSKLLHFVPHWWKILDIACWNWRNSVFLANMWFNIDCFDLVDLNFLDDVNTNYIDNINFKVSDIENYNYKKNYYDAVIMIRLLHFLSKDELNFIFKQLSESIKVWWYVALVYTYKWWLLDKDDIKVDKYSYRIDVINRFLNKYWFEIIYKNKYIWNTTYVWYNLPVQTFDIIAQKK